MHAQMLKSEWQMLTRTLFICKKSVIVRMYCINFCVKIRNKQKYYWPKQKKVLNINSIFR